MSLHAVRRRGAADVSGHAAWRATRATTARRLNAADRQVARVDQVLADNRVLLESHNAVDAVTNAVTDAFRRSVSDFRTVLSLAEELGLPPEDVQTAVDRAIDVGVLRPPLYRREAHPGWYRLAALGPTPAERRWWLFSVLSMRSALR